MDVEVHVSAFLGIKITMKELEKSYANFISEFPEKACPETQFTSDEEDEIIYNIEESVYYDFFEKFIQKYELCWTNFRKYDGFEELDVEICVYILKQDIAAVWSHGDCRGTTESDFINIEDIEDLNSFIRDLNLSKRNPKLFTTLAFCS